MSECLRDAYLEEHEAVNPSNLGPGEEEEYLELCGTCNNEECENNENYINEAGRAALSNLDFE